MFDADHMGGAEDSEHQRAPVGMGEPVGGKRSGRGRVQRKAEANACDIGGQHRKFVERHRSPYALGDGGAAGYTVNWPSLTGVPIDTSHGMFGAQRSKLNSALSSSLA